MLLAEKRKRQEVAGKIGHDEYRYRLGDPDMYYQEGQIRGQGDLVHGAPGNVGPGNVHRIQNDGRPPFAVDDAPRSEPRGGGGQLVLMSPDHGMPLGYPNSGGGGGGYGPLFPSAVPALVPPVELPGLLPPIYKPKPPLMFNTPGAYAMLPQFSPPQPQLYPPQLGGYLPPNWQPLDMRRPNTSPALPFISNSGGGDDGGGLPGSDAVQTPGGLEGRRRRGSGNLLSPNNGGGGSGGGDLSEQEERYRAKMDARRRAQELQQENARQVEDQRRRREEAVRLERAEQLQEEARIRKEREEVSRRELAEVVREEEARQAKMRGQSVPVVVTPTPRPAAEPTPASSKVTPSPVSPVAPEPAQRDGVKETTTPPSSQPPPAVATPWTIPSLPTPAGVPAQSLSFPTNSIIAPLQQPLPIYPFLQPSGNQNASTMTFPSTSLLGKAGASQPVSFLPLPGSQSAITSAAPNSSGTSMLSVSPTFTYETENIKTELRHISEDQRRLQFLVEQSLRTSPYPAARTERSEASSQRSSTSVPVPFQQPVSTTSPILGAGTYLTHGTAPPSLRSPVSFTTAAAAPTADTQGPGNYLSGILQPGATTTAAIAGWNPSPPISGGSVGGGLPWYMQRGGGDGGVPGGAASVDLAVSSKLVGGCGEHDVPFPSAGFPATSSASGMGGISVVASQVSTASWREGRTDPDDLSAEPSKFVGKVALEPLSSTLLPSPRPTTGRPAEAELTSRTDGGEAGDEVAATTPVKGERE